MNTPSLQTLRSHGLRAATLTLILTSSTSAMDSAADERPTNLKAALEARAELSTLRALLDQTGLAPEGPITLVAPADRAFVGFAAPEDLDVVRALLLAHVAPPAVSASDLVTMGAVPTAAGVGYEVSIRDGVVCVGNAAIQVTIECEDGSVIHVVDRVLSAGDTPAISERGRAGLQAQAQAIEAALDEADTNGVRPIVQRAVREFSVRAPSHSFQLWAALSDASNDAAALDGKLREAIEDLRFEPVREAAMPPNFPAFALVSEVVLKNYPRYRMAVASMEGARSQTGPFFTLFNHIKKNSVEMTAPVQMDYDDEAGEEQMMAFLYETADQGETGEDGSVQVIDVAPVMALSIGARGYESDRRVDALRQQLLAWLATHPELEVAGPMRRMGYNSPGVMGGRRFFEVEIPVRFKNLETAGN
ncbi:MAG: heme-binding protein [Planctomycetota bacterium]